MSKTNLDYRELLKDKILLKKESHARYSQSFYAKKIDVSKSYLAAVLAQKKHLAVKKLDLLCEALKLNEDECLSVMISHAQLHKSGKYLIKVLRNAQYEHRIGVASSKKSIEQFSRSEKALHVDEVRSALFALMSSVPHGDIKKAHECLRNKSITLGETKKALDWLVENSFLTLENRNGEKKYVAIQDYIRSQDPPGMQKYIPWAERSISVLSNARQFSPMRIQSLTFSFDENGLLKLQEEYTAFRQRIQDLSRMTKKDGKVFILYIQNLNYTLASLDNSEGA